MARLTLDLSPETETRLAKAAARQGQSLHDYARALLEHCLQPEGDEAMCAFEAQLPRRSPQDLLALAQCQGVKPVASVDDLRADFWPEDESVDEFISTIRKWRRGEE